MIPCHWAVGDHADALGQRGEIQQIIRYEDGNDMVLLRMESGTHVACRLRALELPALPKERRS